MPAARNYAKKKGKAAETAVLNLVRRGEIIVYLMGGGNILFLMSLFASAVYNGIWANDNKWTALRLGAWPKIRTVAIAIIVISVFSFIACVVSIVIRLRSPKQQCGALICWVIAWALCVVVFSLQAYGINETKYGDLGTPSNRDYMREFPEFKTYVFKYFVPEVLLDELYDPGINGTSVSESVPDWVGRRLSDVTKAELPTVSMEGMEDLRFTFNGPNLNGRKFFNKFSYQVPNRSYISAGGNCPFMQPFAFRYGAQEKFVLTAVASCALHWTKLLNESFKLSPDPCRIRITDPDVECIGDWTPSKFQEYWCSVYERKVKDDAWVVNRERDDKGKDQGDKTSQNAKQGRWANRAVRAHSVDSLAAFYRHNSYLCGFVVASLILSIISIILDLKCLKIKDDDDSEKGPRA